MKNNFLLTLLFFIFMFKQPFYFKHLFWIIVFYFATISILKSFDRVSTSLFPWFMRPHTRSIFCFITRLVKSYTAAQHSLFCSICGTKFCLEMIWGIVILLASISAIAFRCCYQATHSSSVCLASSTTSLSLWVHIGSTYILWA